MQTNGTECMIDASYHLEKKRLSPKKTTALVNRQGGFEGVSTLATPRTLSVHMNFNLFSQSHKIAKTCLKWGRTQTDCFRIVFAKRKISNLEEIQVADFLFRENNGKTQ